jgi:hypothetical protein
VKEIYLYSTLRIAPILNFLISKQLSHKVYFLLPII